MLWNLGRFCDTCCSKNIHLPRKRTPHLLNSNSSYILPDYLPSFTENSNCYPTTYLYIHQKRARNLKQYTINTMKTIMMQYWQKIKAMRTRSRVGREGEIFGAELTHKRKQQHRQSLEEGELLYQLWLLVSFCSQIILRYWKI